MKKRVAIVGLIITVMTALLISGCSDFGFNPIGRWKLTENRLYVGETLKDKLTPDKDPRMNNVSIVFEKSGTGYVDSGSENKTNFTYDYGDDVITIYYPNKQKGLEGQPDEIKVVYSVSKDQKTIMLTQYYTDGREEFIYTR